MGTQRAKQLLRQASELDVMSRAGIVLLATVLAYIIFICILLPLIFAPGQYSFFSEYLLSFRTAEHIHLNLIAIVCALLTGIMLAIAIRPRPHQPHECSDKKRILQDVLSKDELQIVAIVQETGEITQDSLSFRLGWNRPKISTILTNLERMNIVQRKREGKTYIVFLAKKD